jgi:aspartate-semialdehyde dehydrogenase
LDNRPLVAIVGSGSLLGRELRELLAELPVRTRLIGADTDEAGVLTEESGEPVVMTELDEENLGGARVVMLAGSAESSRRALQIVSKGTSRPAIVDLTYTLDDHPDSFLRAPAVEPAHFAAPGLGRHVVAHPAAIAVALFLCRLHSVGAVRQAIVQIFEPASERGHRGIEELERQTVNLLSFKPLPKTVYDEQVGFNLLARYGAEAREPLEAVETRVERHLASLLSLQNKVAMPSLRVIQAPVFHGHSISVWAEFEENPGAAAFEASLGSAQVDVRGRDLDPPNIVGMAGQSGIAVGAITADRNNPRACWFWVVGDNIRIMAENAVAVARTLVGPPVGPRPS